MFTALHWSLWNLNAMRDSCYNKVIISTIHRLMILIIKSMVQYNIVPNSFTEWYIVIVYVHTSILLICLHNSYYLLPELIKASVLHKQSIFIFVARKDGKTLPEKPKFWGKVFVHLKWFWLQESVVCSNEKFYLALGFSVSLTFLVGHIFGNAPSLGEIS